MNDSQELAGQGDVGFASAAAALDALIEGPEIGAEALGHQRALHQGGAREFIALFGDAPEALRFMPSLW